MLMLLSPDVGDSQAVVSVPRPVLPHPGYSLLLLSFVCSANRWCINIADALAYLHLHQVTHRDLKAENIFLTDADVSETVVSGSLGCCTGLRLGWDVGGAGYDLGHTLTPNWVLVGAGVMCACRCHAYMHVEGVCTVRAEHETGWQAGHEGPPVLVFRGPHVVGWN